MSTPCYLLRRCIFLISPPPELTLLLVGLAMIARKPVVVMSFARIVAGFLPVDGAMTTTGTSLKVSVKENHLQTARTVIFRTSTVVGGVALGCGGPGHPHGDVNAPNPWSFADLGHPHPVENSTNTWYFPDSNHPILVFVAAHPL